jgi:BMFP domain-containing protein YqiC
LVPVDNPVSSAKQSLILTNATNEIIDILKEVHTATTSMHHQLEDVMDTLFFSDDLSLRHSLISLEKELLDEKDARAALEQEIAELRLRLQEATQPKPKARPVDPAEAEASRARDLAQREEFEAMKRSQQQTPPKKPPPKVTTWNTPRSLGTLPPSKSGSATAPPPATRQHPPASSTPTNPAAQPRPSRGSSGTLPGAPGRAVSRGPVTGATQPPPAGAGAGGGRGEADRTQRLPRPASSIAPPR